MLDFKLSQLASFIVFTSHPNVFPVFIILDNFSSPPNHPLGAGLIFALTRSSNSSLVALLLGLKFLYSAPRQEKRHRVSYSIGDSLRGGRRG